MKKKEPDANKPMCHSKFDVVTEIMVMKANLIGYDN